MLLLPSRTGQSNFPIMRVCVCRRKVEKKTHALFLSLHNSQAARLLITTLPILTQSPTSSLIHHSFVHSSSSSSSSFSNPFFFFFSQNCLLPAHLRWCRTILCFILTNARSGAVLTEGKGLSKGDGKGFSIMLAESTAMTDLAWWWLLFLFLLLGLRWLWLWLLLLLLLSSFHHSSAHICGVVPVLLMIMYSEWFRVRLPLERDLQSGKRKKNCLVSGQFSFFLVVVSEEGEEEEMRAKLPSSMYCNGRLCNDLCPASRLLRP